MSKNQIQDLLLFVMGCGIGSLIGVIMCYQVVIKPGKEINRAKVSVEVEVQVCNVCGEVIKMTANPR